MTYADRVGFFDLIVPDLYYLDKDTGQDRQLGPTLTPMQRRIIADAHDQIDAGRPVRQVVLKARQMGCSTVTQAMMFQIGMVRPNTRGLTMAHENDSAAGILRMSRRYWELAPRSLHLIHTPVSMAQAGLAWSNGSSLRIASARNKSGGRGGTFAAAHLSEAAFYQDPEEMMAGISQAIPRAPYTFTMVESTANGVGNWFHDFWERSKAGQTAYHALFFAWWQHPYYTADHIGLGDRADRPFVDATAEEKILARVFAHKLGMDRREIASRLIWYREILRTECSGDIDKLHQEYPTTDTDAFIATGRNVFSLPALSRVYRPIEGRVGELFRDGPGGNVRFVPDRDGALTIYREPERGHWYTIGIDPSRGPQGDYAVCQVIDRKTWEQVATFRRRGMQGMEMAIEALKLAWYYNNKSGTSALLAPEVNLAGDGIAQMLRSDYPNVFIHQKNNKIPGMHDNTYGWVTTAQTKYEAIGNLKRAVLEAADDQSPSTFTIHDAATFDEMRSYVNVDGKFRNGRGTGPGSDHDDTVMALAIAITCTMYEAASLHDHSPPTISAYQQTPRSAGVLTEGEQAIRNAVSMMEHPPAVTPNVVVDDDGRMGMATDRAGGFGFADDMDPWFGDGSGVEWYE